MGQGAISKELSSSRVREAANGSFFYSCLFAVESDRNLLPRDHAPTVQSLSCCTRYSGYELIDQWGNGDSLLAHKECGEAFDIDVSAEALTVESMTLVSTLTPPHYLLTNLTATLSGLLLSSPGVHALANQSSDTTLNIWAQHGCQPWSPKDGWSYVGY